VLISNEKRAIRPRKTYPTNSRTYRKPHHKEGYETKSKLIELKAQIDTLDTAREKMAVMGARKQGTYHQRDTYFNTPKGRLKLREVEGESISKLVYYEREDAQKPKTSDVIILETEDPETLNAILERALGTRIIVNKRREIYQHEGTQIHLDEVDGLGTFIEFERKIQDLKKDRRVLEELMERLEIKKESLIRESYSDLKLGNI